MDDDQKSGRSVDKEDTGKDGATGSSFDVDRMLDVYLSAVRATLDQALSPASEGGKPSLNEKERLVLMHLARAQALTMNRGMTLWRQISQTMLDYGASARTDAGTSQNADRDQSDLIERAIACLRLIGDLSQTNADEFRKELTEIEAALRAADKTDGGQDAPPS